MSERGTGRGRPNRSRGGLGKYLRARGRGGRGRPAEFSQRLLLDGEGKEEMTEEEAAEAASELARRFGRRQLGTNADRYAEKEVELGSDGEPIEEPEVDLTAFLEKQKEKGLDDGLEDEKDDEDVDHELAHISSKGIRQAVDRKGKVKTIEWDEDLVELDKEKKAAEAHWELKDRFRKKSEKLRAKPVTTRPTTNVQEYKQAPALPTDPPPKSQSEMEQLEDFLDDLLT